MVDQLATGVSLFHLLVSALTADTGVQWVVEDLQSGSAVITLEGHSETPHEVERVVLSYADVGRALEDQEYLTYQPPVKRVAEQIRSFAETVEAVRFQTAEADYTVITGKNSKISPKLTVSIGSVTGRIQTVSNRGRLRFNLYDSTFDRAVGCYLQNGQEELVREAWGRRASVSGRVTRESDTGRGPGSAGHLGGRNPQGHSARFLPARQRSGQSGTRLRVGPRSHPTATRCLTPRGICTGTPTCFFTT